MHPCLNVDEILRHLARELVGSEAKATAVSLACCCKDFEDLVLSVLWESQDQLLSLLKSFPGDAWNVEAGQLVSSLTTFFFASSDCPIGEVFPENPDEGGMESFPKIRSRNPDAQYGRLRGPNSPGCSFRIATPHRQ